MHRTPGKHKTAKEQLRVMPQNSQAQASVISETIITEEGPADSSLREEIKQEMRAIEERQSKTMQDMIVKMEERNKKREAELQAMLNEKNEQLERLQQS